MEYVLYKVIHVPEWEAPAECTEDALEHLAQWDYGEYYGDPIARSEVRSIYAQYIENHDYFLVRDITGDMTLYRKWYGEYITNPKQVGKEGRKCWTSTNS